MTTTNKKHALKNRSSGAGRKPTAAKAKSKSRAVKKPHTVKPATSALPPDHPSLEILEGTEMNYLQLEEAIDGFWKRNVAARARLGLRPNQDIRLAVKPARMSEAEFDKLCAGIDDATYAFLEGLGALWGHSIVFHGDLTGVDREEPHYIQLGRAEKASVDRIT